MNIGSVCMSCDVITSTSLRLSNECSYFPFINTFYTITFPRGTYKVDLYAASGGFTLTHQINPPGKGAYTSGILALSSSKTLYLYTGGIGGNTTVGQHTQGEAGYNGGAPGGYDSDNCPSAGSGGATDIRTISGDTNDALRSRIMVAGGGGSAGCYIYAGIGGNGGNLNGQDGFPTTQHNHPGGKGGGQTGDPQFFGKGQQGMDGTPQNGEAGGAGGGGYYGGLAGESNNNEDSGSGGGGGSSFISGMEGCNAVLENGTHAGHPFHYSGLYFHMPNMISGFNLGDGYAIISRINMFFKTCQTKNKISLTIHFIVLLLVVVK